MSAEASAPVADDDDERYDEHLAWCKRRALVYVELGDLAAAFASMASDLEKHPLTKEHVGLELGTMLLMGGQLSHERAMREWIEGFN